MNLPNLRRRTRRRPVRTTARAEARNALREATRIGEGRPVIVRCPAVPPVIPMFTEVTRTCELLVYKGKTGGGSANTLLYGNAATPSLAYISVTNNNYDPTSASNQRFEWSLDFNDLVNMLESRFHRSASSKTGTDGFSSNSNMHLFSSVRLDKVAIWGPMNTERGVGYPIELAVYNFWLSAGAAATFLCAGECSARAFGTRTVRAHTAISLPAARFVPLSWDETPSTNPDPIYFVLGQNVPSGGTALDVVFSDGDILFTLHITVTGLARRDTASMLARTRSIDLCDEVRSLSVSTDSRTNRRRK